MQNTINSELRVKQVYNAFNQQGGTIHQLISKVNNNGCLSFFIASRHYTVINYLLELMNNKTKLNFEKELHYIRSLLRIKPLYSSANSSAINNRK